MYSHQIDLVKESDDSEKLFYIYQHFQDGEKIHQIDTESDLLTIDDDSLYPYVNNDIEYGLFEDLVESYHLDSQIKDDFQCDQDCYTQYSEPTKDDHPNICTHDYQHIAQNINDLSDDTQQNNLYSSEESASSFTEEERIYGTIRGSVQATQAALSHSRAQTNLTVERGPPQRPKIKKLAKDKAAEKATQTRYKEKQM